MDSTTNSPPVIQAPAIGKPWQIRTTNLARTPEFSPKDVEAVRLWNDGFTPREIERLTGIGADTVRAIVLRAKDVQGRIKPADEIARSRMARLALAASERSSGALEDCDLSAPTARDLKDLAVAGAIWHDKAFGQTPQRVEHAHVHLHGDLPQRTASYASLLKAAQKPN